MLVFVGAKENNFRNSVTGYYKNNKDEQKTIVKTIFDPCEKSFKNLWQAKNKRYRVIFKVYYVITCTSFFANLKRISISVCLQFLLFTGSVNHIMEITSDRSSSIPKNFAFSDPLQRYNKRKFLLSILSEWMVVEVTITSLTIDHIYSLNVIPVTTDT